MLHVRTTGIKEEEEEAEEEDSHICVWQLCFPC
jgi:hypothetical protein